MLCWCLLIVQHYSAYNILYTWHVIPCVAGGRITGHAAVRKLSSGDMPRTATRLATRMRHGCLLVYYVRSGLDMDELDKDYVCSLNEASLKKAQEELNEDPKNRLGAVQTLRQWVLDQPHIKCPLDTKFLLAFLRARKFSQLASRTLLENYLMSRQAFTHWFQKCNVGDAAWHAILESGSMILLPGVDDQGQTLILVPLGFDASGQRFNKLDLLRAFASVFDYLLMSEDYQVNGLVEIVDMSHTTVQQLTFLSMEDRRNFTKCFEKNFPSRMKRIHVYNPGIFIDSLLTVMKFVMSEKLQKRVVNHGCNLESLYEHVPLRLLPREYLPDDYTGPSNGTIKEIIAHMKEELLRPDVVAFMRERSNPDYGVTESKRPKDAPPVGSFRKLVVD